VLFVVGAEAGRMLLLLLLLLSSWSVPPSIGMAICWPFFFLLLFAVPASGDISPQSPFAIVPLFVLVSRLLERTERHAEAEISLKER
jgi:hypothetical protein